MYKSYENQYFEGLDKILRKGVVCVSGRQSQGDRVTRTKRTWGVSFEIDLEEEFPVLRCKHVAVKSAIREILWIMCKQSNNIHDLRPHIWDKWADPDGSIGKAYGYQVHIAILKNNHWYDSQVHYVLETLMADPSSRHGIIDIWNPQDLGDMNLVPCCYSSHFAILDGRLNCMLVQRSADYIVGVPFNTTQYAALTCMFARHLGVRPGVLYHTISDAHVYESQYGNFDTEELTSSFKTLLENHANPNQSFIEKYGKAMDMARIEFKVNRDDTDFFNIGDDDFEVTNYEIGSNCFEDIRFEVEA